MKESSDFEIGDMFQHLSEKASFLIMYLGPSGNAGRPHKIITLSSLPLGEHPQWRIGRVEDYVILRSVWKKTA